MNRHKEWQNSKFQLVKSFTLRVLRKSKINQNIRLRKKLLLFLF